MGAQGALEQCPADFQRDEGSIHQSRMIDFMVISSWLHTAFTNVPQAVSPSGPADVGAAHACLNLKTFFAACRSLALQLVEEGQLS